MVAYFDVLPLYTLGMRSVNEFLSKFYTSFGYTFSGVYKYRTDTQHGIPYHIHL